MIASGKTEVHFAGIDLSPHVRAVTYDPKDLRTMSAKVAGLHSFTLRVQWNPDRRWRFLFAQPRIRRMHAAYGRRRGRGRW